MDQRCIYKLLLSSSDTGVGIDDKHFCITIVGMMHDSCTIVPLYSATEDGGSGDLLRTNTPDISRTVSGFYAARAPRPHAIPPQARAYRIPTACRQSKVRRTMLRFFYTHAWGEVCEYNRYFRCLCSNFLAVLSSSCPQFGVRSSSHRKQLCRTTYGKQEKR